MRCPKCGYLSFDSLSSCRKCSRDLVETAEKLQGTAAEHEEPFFLGPTLGVAGEEELEPVQDLPTEGMISDAAEPLRHPEDTSTDAVTEETAEEEIDLDALIDDLPVAEEDEAEEADFDLGLDDLPPAAEVLTLEPEATEGPAEAVTVPATTEEVELDFDIEDSATEEFSLKTESEENQAAAAAETTTAEDADIDFNLEGLAAEELDPKPESKKKSTDEDQGAGDAEDLADFDLEDTAATEAQTEELPLTDFEDVDLSGVTISKDSGQQTDASVTDESFGDLSSLSLESDDDLADIEFLDTDDDEPSLTTEDLASGLTLEKDE